MFGTFAFRALRLLRSIWFRPALYAVSAVLILLIAPALGPLIPDGWPDLIGDGAVESTLDVLANSMLAVAIFSLSTMVAAFQMATQNASPRARTLVTQDHVAQNAIATFLGAFLFSVVGMIGLTSEYYEAGARFILFVCTILLIVIVVATLISWIMRLSSLGGVGEAADRLETAAREGFRTDAALRKCGRPVDAEPENFHPLVCDRIGYVQHVDGEKLGALAEKAGLKIHVAAMPGAYVAGGRPLALTDREPDDETRRAILDAFLVGDERTFEHDPRFGLIVLSEIAQRALSPAVNDPGTAIDIIGTSVRVLAECSHAWTDGHDEARCDGLSFPAPDPEALIVDAFRAIARDGAGMIEVAIRLQKGLDALATERPGLAGPARRLADEAFERSRSAMTLPADIALLEDVRDTLDVTARE